MTTRKTAYPDASTTIAIATEMLVSIKSIIDALPELGNKARKPALSEEIKHVADTARLISLRLVTLLCDEANVFAEMIESGKMAVDESKIEAITGVMVALHRYVGGAANGKIGSGFPLHAAYVDMMKFMPSQGVALRQELFLPVSPVYGPNSPNYSEGRFVAEVARYNDEFRQAMKRYESKKDLETINAMRTTLVTMETKNPPSNFRMLLSLAISFMDIAMRNGGKISKENEPLIYRLDRELSGVVKGEIEVDEGTISWFMCVIGQAAQFSARIRAFQESYELVRLVEEGQNLTVNDQTVAAMRNALNNAQRTWESSLVTQGDVTAAKSACFALAAVSNTLGDYALKTMALAMGSLADGIVEKRVPADPEVAVFGASIIVSMNDRLERVLADPKGGRASADHHRDRVRQVLSGKRPGDLSREISNQGGHIAAILSELNNDLSSAEQIIDQCMRDGAKQAKREDIDKLFNIVKSALSFVNLNSASDYATQVASHVDQVLAGLVEGNQPDDAKKRIMAESVMVLHRYVTLVNIDQGQAEQLLQRGQALFATVQEPASQVQEEEGIFDVCNDEDLGPIFFEEAKGVVAELILPGLAKLRINVNDEPTMLDVRRGFHTLKGSSRMVELNNLGLVGQHTEYALNIYRDNRNLVPSALFLDWLEEAAHFFHEAVGLLEQGLPARVNVGAYEAVYNHFSETNVFIRVDLSSAVSPSAKEESAIFEAENSQESSVASEQDLMVHIPETGSVIMPAIGLLVEEHEAPHDAQIDEAVALEGQEISQQDAVSTESLVEDGLELVPGIASETVQEASSFAEQEARTLPVIEFGIDFADSPTMQDSVSDELENLPFPIDELVPQQIEDTLPVSRADEPVAEHVTETAVESSGEVSVGEVVIPTQLYIAFVNEAGTFQGVLSKAISDAVNGKRQSVDFEVMRMAHSLAGMGRATGLKGLTHLAEKVEEWIALNQDRQVYITENTRAVLLDAMEALDAMIVGVEDKLEPMMEVGIVERLTLVIEKDERRIAMAEDTRVDVTESIIEQLANESDLIVSDEGVAPSSVLHHQEVEVEEVEVVQAGQAPEVIEAVEIVEALVIAVPAVKKEEVTKASEAFRHETDTPHLASADENNPSAETVFETGPEHEPDCIAEAFLVNGEARHEEAQPGKAESVVDSQLVSGMEPIQVALQEEALSENAAAHEGPFVDAQATEPLGQVDLIGPQEAVAEPVEESISLLPSRVLTMTASAGSHAPDKIKRAPVHGAIDWLAVVASRDDDVDGEMFEIFLEEANDRFEEIDTTLSALGEDIFDKRMTNVLKRAVHTLKGSANTAGCRKVGVIFHHLEDLMDTVGTLNADNLAVLQSGVDAAFAGLKAMRSGKSVESAIKRIGRIAKAVSEGAAQTTVADVPESSQVVLGNEKNAYEVTDEDTHSTSSITATSPTVDRISSTSVMAPSNTGQQSTTDVRSFLAAKKSSKSEEEEGTLRVSAKLLDKMVKSVGEINIARSRMGMNVDISKMALTGLASSLDRMYGYLRQVEMEAERQMSAGDHESKRDNKFDALQMDTFTRLQELTRRVAEAQNDVMTQQSAAVGAARDMEDALATQNVLTNELSGDLDAIRQVRVSSIVPALKRVVRAACRDTGKMGEIFFDADVEIDRGILSKVMGSLEHILRNAVAHGIEEPAKRTEAGKAETGIIEFRAFQDGGEVVIELRDDGRGMDTKQIYESAIKKGVIKEGAQMSEGQIRDLIFEPGFSTASTVTDISGRGVGLDVVRSDISAMGGRVELTSELGAGTVFTLRVPATLSVIAGAEVTTNGHMYVIPVAFIDRLVRVNAKELETAYSSRKLLVTDENTGAAKEYEFWGMWQISGANSWDSAPISRNSILLMRNDRVAVHIDGIRPATEFVFRPLGPQIANSSGLIGSTISSSGNASLVLDPSRVSRNLRALVKSGQANAIRSLSDQKKSPLVLVVDDSMTVRKVTARLLKREGFRCAEAENGMKALEVLQTEMPDVILMDIEMPVMNGFDASQAIRATPETAHIPIIMITSRVGESHRQRALELGVNAYLGKPYNESDLMSTIREYTGSQMVANG